MSNISYFLLTIKKQPYWLHPADKSVILFG